MSCVKPKAHGARTKMHKKIHKEKSHQSGSTKIVVGGKHSSGGHGPRASGASTAGLGTTASSFKEHLSHAAGQNVSHYKRGMR
jgi:hypothetical protein